MTDHRENLPCRSSVFCESSSRAHSAREKKPAFFCRDADGFISSQTGKKWTAGQSGRECGRSLRPDASNSTRAWLRAPPSRLLTAPVRATDRLGSLNSARDAGGFWLQNFQREDGRHHGNVPRLTKNCGHRRPCTSEIRASGRAGPKDFQEPAFPVMTMLLGSGLLKTGTVRLQT